MNQHMNQDLLWKNPRLIPSAANGNLFDDKAFNGSEKIDPDRSISNSSFNQCNYKMTAIPKVKEYKNYNEIESGPFVDGMYFQNNHDTSMSKMRNNADQTHLPDEYLWFYLDPRNNVQGPFLDSQMFQWWSQGIYFQNSLLMKRKCDADFSTLQDYSKRFNGVPFSRKDVRVPPMAESLSAQSSKPYPHRTDPNNILHLLSSGQCHPPDDFSKAPPKAGLVPQPQRMAPHYNQSAMTAPAPNGISDRFHGSGSLSHFVNLSLGSPGPPPKQTFNGDVQKTLLGYQKAEGFLQGGAWGAPCQPQLADSVWTSTSNDTIISSNPVWSRSTVEASIDDPSLVSTIFHDSLRSPPDNGHRPSQTQASWDSLDPAIIKVVPPCEPAPSHIAVDHRPPKATESPGDSHRSPTTPSISPAPQADGPKHPWAELVRRGTSKAGCPPGASEAASSPWTCPQHKGSLTSSSSDEYEPTGLVRPADRDLEALLHWATAYLEDKPGISTSVDIGTLIEVLVYVESPYELEATMRENLPQLDSISDFVRLFLEKRRPLRQRLFSEHPHKTEKGQSAKVEEDDVHEEEDDCQSKWQVKSKGHGSSTRKNKRTNNSHLKN